MCELREQKKCRKVSGPDRELVTYWYAQVLNSVVSHSQIGVWEWNSALGMSVFFFLIIFGFCLRKTSLLFKKT